MFNFLYVNVFFCTCYEKENKNIKKKKEIHDKFSALDDKWSERFNRLEALLLAKSMEPPFSADVRVTPVHSPPANVACDSESSFQPANRPVDTSQRTGPDSSAALQPSAGKLTRDTPLHGSSSSERTGPDIIALQQQSAGKLKHRLKSATQGRTGPDTASQKQKSTGKPITDLPLFLLRAPTNLLPTDPDPLASLALFHRLLRKADRTVFLALSRMLRVSSQTRLQWIFS